MLRFLIRRALGLVPTLFVIVTLAFVIVRAAPGGPFSSERNLPPEILANIQRKYHLDEPLPRQYLRYLGDFARGDLGPSYRYRDYTVNELIRDALPPSMLIGTLALALAVGLGVGLGLLAALRQDRWLDRAAMALAVLGISVPLFVTGPVLKLLLALRAGWLPTSGWLDDRGGAWVLVLPVLTLTLPYLAGIARLTRASALEVLRADYIRTARAKGLSERTVVWRHALKNALLPIITIIGIEFGGNLAGAVLTESIFAWPGIGNFLYNAVLSRDYLTIQGGVAFVAVAFIICNLLVDVCYAYVNPRIRY